MKRLISSLVIVIIATVVIAQTPQSFKYQAVVRDNSGSVVAEQAVGFKVEILKGSTGGEAIYSETHNKETNQFGLVNLEIGSGTTNDDFSTISWGGSDHFLRISIDITGGIAYELMGTSQLLSVPYALHANVADSVAKESQTLALDGNTLSISSGNSVVLPTGGETISSGKYIVLITGDISDAEAAEKIANEVGTNTSYIFVQNTTQLSELIIKGTADLVKVIIRNNESLESIICYDLEYCVSFTVSHNESLKTVNANSLRATTEAITFGLNPLIETISFSNLEYLHSMGFGIQEAVFLSSLNLSSFKDGEIYITNTSLSSIDFSNFVSDYVNINLSYNALTSDAVNGILAHFVSLLPNLSGNIYLNDQTPPAPPTGQGLIDKETLQSNGVDVYTD